MWKIFVPDSKETDEDFVNKQITYIIEGQDVEDAIQQIVPYAKNFSTLIGVKAVPSLLNALDTFSKNADVLNNILIIFHSILKDYDSIESHSNAGYFVEKENSISRVFNCLSSQDQRVRMFALAVISDLLHIQPADVQNIFINNDRAQKLFLDLANDQVEQIQTNFYFSIPNLVQGELEVQQMILFQLMDSIIHRLQVDFTNTIPIIYSLLENNTKTQQFFVESGHLSLLLPGIKSNDLQTINFLRMLFTSSNAPSFRRSLSESQLLNPLLRQSIEKGPQRSQFLQILGLVSKGNETICQALTPSIEDLLNIALASSDPSEKAAAMFCIDSYNLKYSSVISDLICEKMKQTTAKYLVSFSDDMEKAKSLIEISCSCIIANQDNLQLYLGSFITDDQDFFSLTIVIMHKSEPNSILLPNILKFLSASIWESSTAVRQFISTISSLSRNDGKSTLDFLVSLCLRGIEDTLRSISCLLVLESLLFKSADQSFASLISAVHQVGLNNFTSVVYDYGKQLNEDESDKTLWCDFATEVIRQIKKNAENLLSDNAEIKSDSSQIAELNSKLNKLQQENEQLKERNTALEEDNRAIENLEQELEEHQRAESTYEDMINRLQEQLTEQTTENEKLLEEVSRMKSKMLGGIMTDEPEDNSDLLKQIHERDERITELQEENTKLKMNSPNDLFNQKQELEARLEDQEDNEQQLKALKEEINTLLNQIDSLRNENNQLKLNAGNNVQVSNYNNDLMNELANLKETEKNLKSQVSQLVKGKNDSNEKNETIEILEEEVSKLNNELITIKKQQNEDIERYTSEIMKLKASLTKTENELIEIYESKEQNNQSNEESDSKDLLIAELTSKNQLLEDKCKQAFNELEKMKKLPQQSNKKENEIELLKKDNMLKDNSIKKLEKEISENEKKIQSLNDKLDQITSQANDRDNNKIKIELQQKDQELRDLKFEQMKYYDSIRKLNDEIMRLEACSDDNEKLKRQISRKDEELKQKSEIISLLEQKANDTTNSNDLTNMQQLLDEKNEKIDELNEMIKNSAKQDELGKMKLKLKEKEEENKDKDELIEILKEEINSSEQSKYKKELELKEQEIKEKDEIIKELEQKIGKSKESKDSKQIEALQKEIKHLESQQHNLIESISAKDEEIRELTQECERLQSITENNEAQDDSNLKQKLKLIGQQLIESQEILQDKENKIREIREECDNLKIQLEEKQTNQMYQETNNDESILMRISSMEEELSKREKLIRQLQRRIRKQEKEQPTDRTKVLEDELKQLRKLNETYTRQQKQAKELNNKNMELIRKLEREKEVLKTKLSTQVDDVDDIKSQLVQIQGEKKVIEGRHQSALRLIGELWTKNQELLRRPLDNLNKSV